MKCLLLIQLTISNHSLLYYVSRCRTFFIIIYANDIMQNQRLIQRDTQVFISFSPSVILWLFPLLRIEMEATCKAERHS
jgi:hypothetical protein